MIINTDFLLNQIYPVGSLYLTTNETNPSIFLGGTWEMITSDAYLKIVSSNAGSLGGTNKDHKIPISSMPSHNHSTRWDFYAYQDNGSGIGGMHRKGTWREAGYIAVDNAGGGQAYYPYYYGIYVFRRTA